VHQPDYIRIEQEVNKSKTFYIYCATSPSGKRYVGQTSRSIRRRWQNHVAYAVRGRTPIAHAIVKYGADGFLVEELARTSSADVANHLERAYVDTLEALAPSGYNLANGGTSGWRAADTVRAKLRAAWSKNPARRLETSALGKANAGKKASDETREKMRRSHRTTDTPETCAKRKAWWTPERRAWRAEQTRRRYHPDG
jgi:group I intron endonuclease